MGTYRWYVFPEGQAMSPIIIHVDIDAFYAAVEVRDDPGLAGKPLIIGALPHERGVVSTCSYEARKYGVRSAMSIKEAYRRCPDGIYMHPNMEKYKQASDGIHEIWNTYTDVVEYISLDEGYLDVTGSLGIFKSAGDIGFQIKARTKEELGLTCSVGIGYSMASAKLASEEKKPDGFFEILSRDAFVDLVADRNVRVLHGVGAKSAEKLEAVGLYTVRDIRSNRPRVKSMFGKHGAQIVQLADGIDNRVVTPYYEAEAKSIGREHTFQQDITDFLYLRDVLVLLARDLSTKLRFAGRYCRTITLKVTYANMNAITRSKSGDATNSAGDIYRVATDFLGAIEKRPIRLIGISLDNLCEEAHQQLTLEDIGKVQKDDRKTGLNNRLLTLQRKYGADVVKTGMELEAEKRLAEVDRPPVDKDDAE